MTNYKEFNLEEHESFDQWSIGHFLFGCMMGAIYMLLFSYFEKSFMFDFGLGMFVSIFFSVITFTIWELLEHTIVKKIIYFGILKFTKWMEHPYNAILDVIIASTGFYSLFLLYIFVIQDIFFPISLLIVINIIIPIYLVVINKKQKK